MSSVQVTRSASLVQVTATRPQVAVGTPSIVSASAVPFTPAGDIAATNVQAAIAELDAEKQPLDAELSALAALTSAADQLPYFTGLATAALTTLTAYGRSLIAAADAPAAKVVLGLGLLASSVSGNTATIAGALTGARNYTLPDASMTFAGQNIDNAFSVEQTIVAATGLTTRPASGQDGLRIQGRAAGTLGYNLTLTTVGALAADTTVYLPTVTGATVLATNSTPAAGHIPFSTGTNYAATLSTDLNFDTGTQTLRVGTISGSINTVLLATAGTGGAGTARVRLGTNVREWEMKAAASPYTFSIDYVGTDTPLANILSLTKAGAATFVSTLSATSLTATGLTSGRVPFITTGGLLTDSSGHLYGTAVAGPGSAGFAATVGASAATDAYSIINANAGRTRALAFQSAGALRWALVANTTAEGGADAGSSLELRSYTDAGAFIDTPWNVVRAAGGAITFARPVTITGAITHSGSNTASGSTASRLAYFGGTSGDGAAFELRGSTYAGSPDTGFLRVGSTYVANWSTAGFTLSSGVLTVPNGTAAAPGIRTTTYAHGLFSQAATALGFAAAGVEVGRATSTAGWSFFNSSDTAGSVASANRTITSPGASSIHNGFNCTFADNNTGSLTYFSSAYRGILNILGSGSNAGYDRGLTFEAYHRGNGTRAAVTGAFLEVGTYNGGSDSTGTITDLVGIKLQQLKTASSVVTTGVLLDLGACVGTTKYAIRSASNSGIVSLGDTTDATTTSDGSVRLSGGLSVAKSIVCAGSAGMFVDIKNSTGELRINGTKVSGPRDTGWTAMTGTTDKATAYDTATVTLAQLAGRVMALQAALTTHGKIGT